MGMLIMNLKNFISKNIIKFGDNKFITISNFGFKIYSLKNDSDDVSFVVIDRNSPDKKVLFEKTYTMDELKGNSSVLPSDYIEEEQLGGLFDEGVKTK